MKSKDLRTKSIKELETLLKFLQENLRDLRFRNTSKQLKNIREIRKVKKDIARVFTILRLKKGNEKKNSSKLNK